MKLLMHVQRQVQRSMLAVVLTQQADVTRLSQLEQEIVNILGRIEVRACCLRLCL